MTNSQNLRKKYRIVQNFSNSLGFADFFCCVVSRSEMAAMLSLPVNGVPPRRPDEFFRASIADESTAALATAKETR